MATLGTTSTTVLTSYRFPGTAPAPLGVGDTSAPALVIPTAAQIATLAANIKDDFTDVNLTTPAGPVWPGALHPTNNPQLLYVPNRGVLKILPGDYIAIDTVTGWPILVSSQAVNASGSFWHFA